MKLWACLQEFQLQSRLVQRLNQHIPRVNMRIAAFAFIPSLTRAECCGTLTPASWTPTATSTATRCTTTIATTHGTLSCAYNRLRTLLSADKHAHLAMSWWAHAHLCYELISTRTPCYELISTRTPWYELISTHALLWGDKHAHLLWADKHAHLLWAYKHTHTLLWADKHTHTLLWADKLPVKFWLCNRYSAQNQGFIDDTSTSSLW